MKKLQGGKVLLFFLVLVTTLALVTWAFFSFKNGLLASTTEKQESTEKEIKIKILDQDQGKSETWENRENDYKDIFPTTRFPDAKEFDDIRKEFEETQREMQEIIEEMRRSRTQMMKELMGDIDDEDFSSWRDLMKSKRDDDLINRDNWDITPRFPDIYRTPGPRFRPDDLTFHLWGKDYFKMPELGVTSTAMDVRDYKDKIVIKCDLPGMDKDNIELTLKGRDITIKGAREVAKEQTKEKEGGRTVISERSFGQFSRTISLPQNIDPDNITSKYEDGVLEIIIPKIEEEEPDEKKIIIESK